MKRILLALALLVTLGVAPALTATPALASGMYEICDGIMDGYCINAWNGGPFVKAYTSGVTNDYFQVNSLGNGLYDIEDMNTGTYVGDYNNDQYDARAGLVGYGGWGYRFYKNGCEGITGGMSFWNVHWNNTLSAPDSDGAQFYLNTTFSQCFIQKQF
jgi:hypothetical protein